MSKLQVSPYLYVTPREQSMSTRCRFLGVAAAPLTSSETPLLLAFLVESDLYTEAIVNPVEFLQRNGFLDMLLLEKFRISPMDWPGEKFVLSSHRPRLLLLCRLRRALG